MTTDSPKPTVRRWMVMPECGWDHTYVIADSYEEALAVAGKWFPCCRDTLDVEPLDESKHKDLSHGRS